MYSALLFKKYHKLALVFLLGLVAWWLPHPEGVTDQAWHLLIIFVLTIFAVILKPLPMGVLALTALAVGCVTATFTIETALSVYGTPIVWLVVFAFFIARGLRVTGLGSRISYFFVRIFGRNTLGLSYGFVMTDLILAPAIPSNTARGAGIIFPVLKSLSEEFEGNTGLETGHRKIGSFLVKVAFQANVITSAMFLTALAGNPLAAAIAESQGIHLTWATWALAASVPGLICLLVMPLIVYLIYPPQMKEIKNARQLAEKRLAEMGRMSGKEIIMFLTFIALLLLWTMGEYLGMHAALAALLGVVVLLLSGVLTWDDILKERAAWGTFIWFGALIMLAGQLESSGFLEWFSVEISNSISSLHWITAFACVTFLYFYSHYFFASTTALITAIYAVFLQVMVTSGAPGFAAAMMLAAFSCLSSCLTHYGTGSAPVYFGAHYVSMKSWWTIGAVLGIFYIAVWWFIGTAWWQLLGLI